MEEATDSFKMGWIGCCHDLDGRSEAGESTAGSLALLGVDGVLTLEKEQGQMGDPSVWA